MYGGQTPADFVKKFEQPYAPLLAAGVKFQASLGNHDRPENVSYKLFNMNGERYYSYARRNVRFFALDSTRMDAKQLAWLETSLAAGAGGLEDLLLPSSAVLERQPPRLIGRSARAAGADLRQAWCRCRVLRPRPRLRASEAAEGHHLLRVRRGRTAATREHETDRADRRVLRPGPELHARGSRRKRAALSSRLSYRQDRRFRCDPSRRSADGAE